MSEFEERYICLFIKNNSRSYLCFINVFMVWTKSEKQLRSFINELYKKHHYIKIDFKFSKFFLDTSIYKDNNNRLQTSLYKKPTDC